MTDLRIELINAIEEHCAATGRSPAGISNAIANDGKFYDRIKNEGGGFTVKTYENAMRWLQENNPKNLKKRSSN